MTPSTPFDQTMTELEKLGTEQNRKVYRRHGASDLLFGVSYANLKLLKKKIKRDHELARQLWATGNHDARILAMMIADPDTTTRDELESWGRDLADYMVTDALTGYVRGTPYVHEVMEAWIASSEEWIGAAGWGLMGYLALDDGQLPDTFFEPYLALIERGIHSQKNRVRYAMNNALIAIGARNEALEARALAVAGTIGEVEVDHGETNCKTPDAAPNIKKTRVPLNKNDLCD